MQEAIHKSKGFDVVSLDITNRCNLKCKFCLSDYGTHSKSLDMTEDLYQKALGVLPYLDGPFPDKPY